MRSRRRRSSRQGTTTCGHAWSATAANNTLPSLLGSRPYTSCGKRRRGEGRSWGKRGGPASTTELTEGERKGRGAEGRRQEARREWESKELYWDASVDREVRQQGRERTVRTHLPVSFSAIPRNTGSTAHVPSSSIPRRPRAVATGTRPQARLARIAGTAGCTGGEGGGASMGVGVGRAQGEGNARS